MPSTTAINLEARPRVAAAMRGEHSAGKFHYQLPQLWCLHLYDYHGELRVNGEEFTIRPRHVSLIPPAVKLEYLLRGPSIHLFTHFRIPRAAAGHAMAIPLMQDLGNDFMPAYRELERAIELFPRWPTRTEVTVWNILWSLADRHWKSSSPLAGQHAAVDRVMEIIERRLHEPLYGEELARGVGLSQHHLIRIFRAATGSTPQQYIRQRRMQRAQHLLMHSTLPIKAIASEVGIPDLHLFNKTTRHILGKSPREYRQAAGRY